MVEPTDKNVLEPQFFENAKIYQAAHKAIFDHPVEQKKYYNLMIGACISCHENYCSGPLRRINKMPITDYYEKQIINCFISYFWFMWCV